MKNESECIAKAREGDRSSFAELVHTYQGYVFTICFRVLKNREEAEEAAQDTFLKIFKTIKSFEGKSKFSSWLYSIAFRTAIDRSRLKKQAKVSLNNDERHFQIEETGDTPLETTEKRNLKQVLQEVVQQLPVVDGSIITLYYQGEQTIKEIAETLNLSVSNVKVKLYRTRGLLRKKLERHLQAEIKDLI